MTYCFRARQDAVLTAEDGAGIRDVTDDVLSVTDDVLFRAGQDAVPVAEDWP